MIPNTLVRTIGFYSLQLKDNSNGENLDPAKLREVLNYIAGVDKGLRRREMPDSRFYFLCDIEDHPGYPDIQTWIFKHAEYGRLPPLINKDTLQERDNPKDPLEGERGNVHAAIRYDDDEAILLLEEARTGITIKRIVYYLSQFVNESNLQNNFTIVYSLIPTGNFLQELNKLTRVRAGYIHTSKKLLGSNYLNLSNRLEEAKENIVIEVKAEKGGSIVDMITDVFGKLVASEKEIQKIRVFGLNEQTNQVILDTDFIRKTQPLEVEIDIISGDVRSENILSRLILILSDL